MMLVSEAPVTALSIWVVYFNPSDYPGKWVVRESWVRDSEPKAAKACAVVDSLDDARATIPQRERLTRLDRHPTDDAVIVETWL